MEETGTGYVRRFSRKYFTDSQDQSVKCENHHFMVFCRIVFKSRKWNFYEFWFGAGKKFWLENMSIAVALSC